MTKNPRRRPTAPPAKKPEPPAPDVDYGHGAVEGEPGGAQPGPALPPQMPDPPTPPIPADPGQP